jgi:outer membrane protein assembly factor BamE
MKLARRALAPLFIIFGLMGCSSFHFPGVHKINIQQGHIITQEMVDQLKLGMNKRQVRYVLGNTLLPNTFNDDRWDYFYSRRKGSNGDITQHLFSVYFDNDKLAKTEGDYIPGPAPASKEKSEKYLDDIERDVPLPINDEQKAPPPEAPKEVQSKK